jgi:SPP1 family predicted phage head-tail adaptor
MRPIGNLRHRLVIEAPDETPDGAGGVVRAWTALATVWGEIEPLSVDDVLLADKRVGLVTHRIHVRHRADFDIGHRFRLGARAFAIRGLRDPEERGAFLECLCAEEP